MSDQLPMPTRGPAQVRTTLGGAVVVDAKEHAGDDWFEVCELARNGDQLPNADLIAAAVNAATAAQDMGYDPIGAVQALPMLLDACKLGIRAIDSGDQARLTSMRHAMESILAAARTRGGAK